MRPGVWIFCLIVLGLAVLLAAFSPLASSSPDGLERVAEDHGQAPAAGQPERVAPMPDYKVPGVRNESLRTILAGVAGTLVVFGLALGLGRLIGSRRKPTPAEDPPGATPASR